MKTRAWFYLPFFFSGSLKTELVAFLPHHWQMEKKLNQADVVFAWAKHRQKAAKMAARANLPLSTLSKGFLGWTRQSSLCSVLLDDLGVFCDTQAVSRLEKIILQTNRQPENDIQAAWRFIVDHHLTQHTAAPISPDYRQKILGEEADSAYVVLVCDEAVDDECVVGAQAKKEDFLRMILAACQDFPDSAIWLKTCANGHLTTLPENIRSRVFLIDEDINAMVLLKQVDCVYCVTAHMGFEALLCGKKVVTFGMPWYAAWGVTEDRHPLAQDLFNNKHRRATRSVVQLFQAAYVDYAQYVNPNTQARGTLWDVLFYLSRQAEFNRLLSGDVYCVLNYSLWKRAILPPFLRYPSCRAHFVWSLNGLKRKRLPENAKLLAWGKGRKDLLDFVAQHNYRLLRMEDGFIRSVGLGANLTVPLSLVLDDVGIYFDATQESRLEYVLQHYLFSEKEQEEASVLQALLIENAISKYNVGDCAFSLPDGANQKRVLLVTGQVEDDASIRFGALGIARNADLLAAVRQENPDAFIIYKPHPDVVSGNRKGHIPDEITAQLADLVAPKVDVLSCLNLADEVHVMTSLTGFEALLRGKKVVCYGVPFYSGWGLTHDKINAPRRTRRLTLPELIAGALILYPQYVHPDTGQHIDAQTAIALLQQQKQERKNQALLSRKSGLHRKWRKAVQFCRVFFRY